MSGTLNFTLPAVRPLRFPSSDDCLPSSSSSSFSVKVLRRPYQCRASIRSFATEANSAVIGSRRPASLYEVLRVSQSASPREIKSAYRNLAKIYHPDSAVNRADPDDMDFIEIHNAYATLSDPSARAIYDLSLMAIHGRRRPFSASSTVDQDCSPGFYSTRRWETDQCW
ncbi:chaperone protein dnaJ 11, chloroplastic-like [Senna tora]|uniref:Chaperone protein dnaJ 11, chloroplastic-like n=1 Tax=Senna tora TaxID=362788 RepID=A0A834T6N7_9FABA|nr:chaperone protein dnaJ 11, chloroplastic-like [Senna tora]